MKRKYESFYWLNEESEVFLKKDEGYLRKGVEPKDRIRDIANAAENILGIKGFADKFYGYMEKGYYSLATPVWCNFGNERGLPVSCFNSHIPDSMSGIMNKNTEVAMMTKYGGGTSGYFGDIRPRGTDISKGGESTGSVSFMKLFEVTTSTVKQGNARRGFFAAYLPIDHPDFREFIKIRDTGNYIQDMAIGVCISDEFMEKLLSGDQESRELWALVIKKKYESGFPYVFFSGNANKQKPQWYKDQNYEIKSSNLCSEIFLPSSEDESFVCVLSSLNLLHWDEMKQTDAIETLIYFLDAVNEEFVRKTANDPDMKAPHKFAKRHKALGAGVLGWHSYLQSNMIEYESMEAKMLNNQIFSEIDKRTKNATQELAKLLGESEVTKGYGVRNSTRLAIAPTKSSSFILGQSSPSIEPLHKNFFVDKLAKIISTYKNPYLKEILAERDKDTAKVWKSIRDNGGSVQHLDFLDEKEKNVFKTFGELSQKEVLIQASNRQKYIDQGQSLNFMIPPNTPAKDVSNLMIDAWKMNIKSLYYQRSANPAQELSRSILECKSCEG